MLKRIVAVVALMAALAPAGGARAGGTDVPGGFALLMNAPDTYSANSPYTVSGWLYAWAAAPVLVEVARGIPSAMIEIFVDDVRVAEATTDIQGFYQVELMFGPEPPTTRTIYAEAFGRIPLITTRSDPVTTRLARILIGLRIDPTSVGVEAGDTAALTAFGEFDDGREDDVTEWAVWSSSNPAVATVSNESGLRGVVTAVAPGTTTIRASLDGIIASATVTVTA